MNVLLKTVLVATDGSAGAMRAEAVANAIAVGCGAKLIILTIARGLSDIEIRRLAHIHGDIGKARDVLIRTILEGSVERAEKASVVDPVPMCDHGDPATSILANAERQQADLIVVGR